MSNIILSEVESLSTVIPDNIVLSQLIREQVTNSVTKGAVFYRYLVGDSVWKYIGDVSARKPLEYPVDLQGRQVIISLVPQTEDNLATPDPRRGLQTTFTPAAGAGSDTDDSAIAYELLNPGDFIHIWDDSGVSKARLADAAAGYEAHAWAEAKTTAGNVVTAVFGGINIRHSGLTIGPVFLSSTTPGDPQSTPPTGGGQLVQVLGTATAANRIAVEIQPPVELA